METPILANRLYVPEALVTERLLERFRHRWTETVYQFVLDEDGMVVMKDGKQKQERVEINHVVTAYRDLLSGHPNDWVGFPRGDAKDLLPLLRRAVDLRTVNPFEFKLRLAQHVTEDARWPDQKQCVDAWLQRGSGIILGQTGAGKTIIGMEVVARLGQETLILSKRGDGERHWEQEFRLHTNVEALEKKLGRRLVGPYRHGKHHYPITVATVQTFLHPKGYGRLIRDQFRFGLVIADEVHELMAPEFVRVFGLWAPLSWLGLTATIQRPDQREFLAYKIVGPVVARLGADQMKPEVKFVETSFSVPPWMMGKRPFSRQWMWVKLQSLIAEDLVRLELVVKNVMESIDDGRLVAVLAERLSLAGAIFHRLEQENYPVCYADGSVPPARRKLLYEELAKGKKYRCICAGLKVMDAMVSIKPLDCLHLVTPVSARHRVMQIFGRTRRPDKGKAIPLVYYYKDHGGQLEGAYRNVRKVCETEGWAIHQNPYNTTFHSMGKIRQKKKK